jgi:hypothetical protein
MENTTIDKTPRYVVRDSRDGTELDEYHLLTDALETAAFGARYYVWDRVAGCEVTGEE